MKRKECLKTQNGTRQFIPGYKTIDLMKKKKKTIDLNLLEEQITKQTVSFT